MKPFDKNTILRITSLFIIFLSVCNSNLVKEISSDKKLFEDNFKSYLKFYKYKKINTIIDYYNAMDANVNNDNRKKSEVFIILIKSIISSVCENLSASIEKESKSVKKVDDKFLEEFNIIISGMTISYIPSLTGLEQKLGKNLPIRNLIFSKKDFFQVLIDTLFIESNYELNLKIVSKFKENNELYKKGVVDVVIPIKDSSLYIKYDVLSFLIANVIIQEVIVNKQNDFIINFDYSYDSSLIEQDPNIFFKIFAEMISEQFISIVENIRY